MAVPFPGRSPVFSARRPDNTSGLIGYWPLDGDGREYSGRSGFNATLRSTPVFTSGLVSPGAMTHTSNENLRFPGNLFSSNVLTVSLWVQLNNVSLYHALFSVYTGNSDSIEIFLDQTNATFFGGNFSNKAASAVVVANRLYHVVLTSDGSVTKLFLDGFPSGTAGTTNFSTFSTTGCIGARTGDTFAESDTIDDVRVYNRALSNAEINALYNQGIARPDDEGEWPALFTAAAGATFLAGWARGSNLPVLGTGTY